MTLAAQYPQFVRPLIEETFNTLVGTRKFILPCNEPSADHHTGQRAMDLPAIIQKEALYCAVGRCAIRLKDAIPFQQWLEVSLVAEAQETNQKYVDESVRDVRDFGSRMTSSYPIVKRRIAWLLGKLVADECLTANNQQLWQVLVHLLQDQGPGSDAVVRLTAAIAIRECVDVSYLSSSSMVLS